MTMQPTPKYRSWSSSWEVYFPARGAVPGKRRFFATEELANSAISEWKKGNTKAHLGQRAADTALYAQSLLPEGVTLTDAVRFYLEHNQGLTKVTVSAVAEAYKLDIARTASEKYEAEQKRVVDILVTRLGADTLFSSLSRATLIGVIKEPNSYWNRAGRKRALSCLITKARELGAIRTNPLDGWTFEDAPKSTPHTLSNETAQSILEHVLAKRHDLLPCFALQLFAGIRTEELCRPDEDGRRALRWEDLTPGSKIEVPVEVSKTKDRRVIAFWPEALTSWLNAAGIDLTKAKGRICALVNLEDAKTKLLADFSDFEQNDFRRTYASNAYALHGALVQDWMGHTDGRMLKRHYRDFIDPEKAKAYFTSKPPSTPANVIPLSA